MRDVLQWLQKIIQKWTPRQDSSGNAAIQVGKMSGGITQVNVTQNIFQAPRAPAARPAPQPSAPVSDPAPQRPVARTTAEHKQVLALMDKLKDRVPVLDFMQREFKTRMVIELEQPQLYRLRRYVEVVLEKK